MTTVTPYVVDASVAVKLFLQEDYTAEARHFFMRYLSRHEQTIAITVPDLLYVECTNILWKRIRIGDLTINQAQQSLDDLHQLALPTVSTASLSKRALDIATQYDISAYDATYVALTERQGVPFITADARLITKLVISPYTIIHLRDFPQ
jgi:predicted nucleic acid-binding protein